MSRGHSDRFPPFLSILLPYLIHPRGLEIVSIALDVKDRLEPEISVTILIHLCGCRSVLGSIVPSLGTKPNPFS